MAKLVASLVQTANDAFIETAIVTQLSTLSRTAWVIDSISFERGASIPQTNLANIEVALSRGTKSAMPTINDRDVLYKTKEILMLTTSGVSLQQMVSTFVPQYEIIIVEENIYLQLDSNATATTNTIYCSIDVRAKQVSEAQRLSILAGRIAS